MNIKRILWELKAERDRLNNAISVLEDVGSGRAAAGRAGRPPKARRGRPRLTLEGRKRLSEMMKKPWAEHKKKARAA